MNALALLTNLRTLFPTFRPALMLDEETGTAVVVQLCDPAKGAFFAYKLDAPDLDREPAEVAAEIRDMHTRAGR